MKKDLIDIANDVRKSRRTLEQMRNTENWSQVSRYISVIITDMEAVEVMLIRAVEALRAESCDE